MPENGFGKPRGAKDTGVGSTVVGEAEAASENHSSSLALSIEAIVNVSQHRHVYRAVDIRSKNSASGLSS